MSPTPSPAGSVGSVGSHGSMGSQGSNNCSDLSSSQNFSQNKLTNGVAGGPMSSPAAIQLPQRIMNMMSSFLVFSNYSLFGLDFWEQSEAMAQEHPGRWNVESRSAAPKLWVMTLLWVAISVIDDKFELWPKKVWELLFQTTDHLVNMLVIIVW